jgi:lipoprotein-releasing system ATP-binding protein
VSEFTPVLSARGIVRRFSEGSGQLEVLSGLDLEVATAQRLAIIGASGSGKTTLLQILGGLDRPDAGTVAIAGRDINALDERARGELRNRTIGFVYQFHHLLPEFSALENVAMPLLVRRVPTAQAMEKARALLARVGLAERLKHRPAELSGGERQRAAVARALVTEPKLVLADEPTGNLDGRNAEQVLQLLLELNREFGTSLVVVTHDPRLANRMDSVLELDAGRLRLVSTDRSDALVTAARPVATPDR